MTPIPGLLIGLSVAIPACFLAIFADCMASEYMKDARSAVARLGWNVLAAIAAPIYLASSAWILAAAVITPGALLIHCFEWVCTQLPL